MTSARKLMSGIGLAVVISIVGPAHSQNGRVSVPYTPSAAIRSNGVIQSQVITPSTADQLAAALDIPPNQVVSASLGTTNLVAAVVSDAPVGSLFPTRGGSFVILSTGVATLAEDPIESELSFQIDGFNSSAGFDAAQLMLELSVPEGAECISFDFGFYSEEFPEFIGLGFSDAFTAEYGQTNLSIVDSAVVAPFNFAFDSLGNVISIDTVFGVTDATGTAYDGATPRIRAFTQLDPELTTATLYFTVQDLGDDALDSAVFMDSLAFGSGVGCDEGAFVDSDGDGLLDDWETDGIDVDDDGTIDLPLDQMGADPQRKDIFVEIDYMVDSSPGGNNLRPTQTAIDTIVAAFANAPVSNPDGSTGITLHVDNGPTSIMIPAANGSPAQTWDSMSSQNALQYQETLGTTGPGGYNWAEFDAVRDINFPLARRDAFHYNVWANKLGGLGTTSGIARGIPSSDFLVSLGGWSVPGGTVQQQAGTFMHELGHNLGLLHGGDDNANFEPNYLSTMNYSFQTRGLRFSNVDGNYDYSRLDPPDLIEFNLEESVGLNAGSGVDSYGTRWWCGGVERLTNSANNPIDWNCDGDSGDTGIVADINRTNTASTLAAVNDWSVINFAGGAVGALGQNIMLPEDTEADEINTTQDEEILTEFGVAVTGQPAFVPTGTAVSVITFEVSNPGTTPAAYQLDVDVGMGTVDVSSVPSSVNLDSGASVTYFLTATVSAVRGADARVTLMATDVDHDVIRDMATASVIVYDALLLAAELPTSRSVNLPAVATVFATVANAGPNEALDVGFELTSAIPADFLYQTTDPATNALTGTPDTPANIPSGGFQSYVLVITPNEEFAPRDVEFNVVSSNGLPVSVVPGLNTVLLSASATPVPDIIALSATVSGDGVIGLPGSQSSAAFAVSSFNLGAGDDITVSTNTGDATLPTNITLCRTNPDASCQSPPASSVTTTINNGDTPTFSVFVESTDQIPFLPAENRINVTFKDTGGVTRGSTSVAVRTL